MGFPWMGPRAFCLYYLFIAVDMVNKSPAISLLGGAGSGRGLARGCGICWSRSATTRDEWVGSKNGGIPKKPISYELHRIDLADSPSFFSVFPAPPNTRETTRSGHASSGG